MAHNTLGEWSDGDDSWIFEVDENTLGEWSDGDDSWIFEVHENTLGEWSDGDDSWIFEVDENALDDSEDGEIIRDVAENDQSGRGEKRKNNDDEGDDEEEKDFYMKESVKQINSKKFRMTAKDYTIRFNNIVSDLDLIESYQRTQAIFEHLLNDVTKEMNDRDHVRFVLRSEQLDTPISLPFMPVAQLTPERVFSQIERVVQSNRDFRLNDTVVVE